jgi:hypothetical protein
MTASAVLVRAVYYGMVFICWLLVLFAKKHVRTSCNIALVLEEGREKKALRVQDFSLLFTV